MQLLYIFVKHTELVRLYGHLLSNGIIISTKFRVSSSDVQKKDFPHKQRHGYLKRQRYKFCRVSSQSIAVSTNYVSWPQDIFHLGSSSIICFLIWYLSDFPLVLSLVIYFPAEVSRKMKLCYIEAYTAIKVMLRLSIHYQLKKLRYTGRATMFSQRRHNWKI